MPCQEHDFHDFPRKYSYLSRNLIYKLYFISRFASVVAQAAKLLRAELPHIHEVEGVKDIHYLKELSTEVAHNIDVMKPLKDYLVEKSDLHDELMKIVDDDDIVNDIENAQVNLRKVSISIAMYVQF